jgi:Restriction endonuclease BglII
LAGDLYPGLPETVRWWHDVFMSTVHLVPADILDRYHVKEWRNAAGILSTACPTEWQDVQEVLRAFRLLKSEVLVGGGNRSLISQRIDTEFYRRGWVEKGFATSITVDDSKIDSPTHAVDCLKGGVAVEMEWNNKDPFFDRDLNNFRLLFELRAIQVGIIITRSWELQTIFKDLGKGASYGKATTHHEKLWPKVEGGGGGGCPVLTFAIKPINFEDDGQDAYEALKARIAAEKGVKKAAKRRGLAIPDEDDEDGDES